MNELTKIVLASIVGSVVTAIVSHHLQKSYDKERLIAGGSPVSSLLENNGFSATANKDYFSKMIGRKPTEKGKNQFGSIFWKWTIPLRENRYLEIRMTQSEKTGGFYMTAYTNLKNENHYYRIADFASEKYKNTIKDVGFSLGNILFVIVYNNSKDKELSENLQSIAKAGDYELAFQIAKGQGLI